MFKKILVAYDGSKGSSIALAHAVILARKLHAELAALWVRHRLPHYPETIDEIAEEEESAQTYFQSIKGDLDGVSTNGRTIFLRPTSRIALIGSCLKTAPRWFPDIALARLRTYSSRKRKPAPSA